MKVTSKHEPKMTQKIVKEKLVNVPTGEMETKSITLTADKYYEPQLLAKLALAFEKGFSKLIIKGRELTITF